MMDYYQLIRGFSSREAAEDYASRLPGNAMPKVVPYSEGRGRASRTRFAVDAHRSYTGGRV